MRRAFAAVALLFSLGCVTTRQEGREMRARIDELEKQVAAQKEESERERERVRAEQAAKAKELQNAMDALNRAARKSGADLAVDLEKAQNELARLRGHIEVVQHKMDALEPATAERDRKLDELSKWVAARQKEIQQAEHPTERGALYALARKKLEAGEYVRARELFTDFLARYRADELAPNAQYWIGETYYAEKRWNDAIDAFQRVQKDWKNSDKVPDALVKIGMSFQAQRDCKNAVLFFEEVMTTHKGTPAAKTARDKQRECRKTTTAKRAK